MFQKLVKFVKFCIILYFFNLKLVKNVTISEVNPKPGIPEFDEEKLADFISKKSHESVIVNCDVLGRPEPNIAWTSTHGVGRFYGKSKYENWSLVMDDLIWEDSGVYTCTLCNVFGCIEHSTILTVDNILLAPRIHRENILTTQDALLNGDAYLECMTITDKKTHYVWIKYNDKDEGISKLQKEFPINRKSFTVLQTNPREPHIYHFRNVKYDNDGWYSCIAITTTDQVMSSYYLNVVDRQPDDYSFMAILELITVLVIITCFVYIIDMLFRLKLKRKQRSQCIKEIVIYKVTAVDGIPIPHIEVQRKCTQPDEAITLH